MTQRRSCPQRITYLKGLAMHSLESYQGGLDQLESLVNDLKSIIRSIEEVADPSWTKQLMKQWGQLEILYALLLDEDRFSLTDEEESEVRVLIEALMKSTRSCP